MTRSGQVAAGAFVTKSAGALTTPSVGPAGVLYVNGVANGATVTITGSNPYKWAVTLPTLLAGDIVQVYITATIATIATASIVWTDTADTKLVSDLHDSSYAGADTAGTTTLLARILGTLDTGTHKPQSGDAYARIGAPIGASIAADVATRLAPTVPGRTIGINDTGGVENVGATGTVGYLMPNAIAALSYQDNALSAAALSAAAVTKITTGIPAAVWGYTTRTLSSFGTLIADIWAYVTRSLTDKLGFGLSAAYDGMTITVQSPVTEDGDAVVDQGYDYYAADERELSWTDDNATWPDLTGATAKLLVDGEEFACTVTTPSGPATVTLELSAAQTGAIDAGSHPFVIAATLLNTHEIPLVRGRLIVRKAIA
jgi:hypothetical protein